MKNNKKALVLFSGGLDSRLVLKILKEQLDSKNIYAIYFLLPFGSRYPDEKKAKDFCIKEKIKFVLIDATKNPLLNDYLEMIRHPKHGRGKALNPCIDCKIWMLKISKDFAEKNKLDIIAMGDVLHQRKMSQNKKALSLIEKKSGLENNILRPLSAKKLQLTIPEKNDYIKRDNFFDIEGKQRKIQIELAKKYNIDFPNPGGGCLLCEKLYSEKIIELLKKENIDFLEIRLTNLGRHFDDSKIILGKNEKENQILKDINKKYKKGVLITPNRPGPSALVQDKNLIDKAKSLMQKYSKNKIKDFQVVDYINL
jgi:tRNA-uridine 2-sulfurtransferase